MSFQMFAAHVSMHDFVCAWLYAWVRVCMCVRRREMGYGKMWMCLVVGGTGGLMEMVQWCTFEWLFMPWIFWSMCALSNMSNSSCLQFPPPRKEKKTMFCLFGHVQLVNERCLFLLAGFEASTECDLATLWLTVSRLKSVCGEYAAIQLAVMATATPKKWDFLIHLKYGKSNFARLQYWSILRSQ